MGANLCSINRSCVGGSMTAAASADGYAICEWRRLQWWRREKTEVKREREASIEKKEMKNEYLSLEELLLASPGAPSERGYVSGGEFKVSRHEGFKRRVHPTRISNCSSFCETERSFAGGDFSICRSESGKLKKKVSFRLPEVTDVIVIYSPEGDSTAVYGNVAAGVEHFTIQS